MLSTLSVMRSTLIGLALLLSFFAYGQTPRERLDEAREEVQSLHARIERHVDATVQFLRDIGSLALHEELARLPEELDRAHEDLEAAVDAGVTSNRRIPSAPA